MKPTTGLIWAVAWALVVLAMVGCAWGQVAPDPGIQSGFDAADRRAWQMREFRHQQWLQQQQYHHQRRLQCHQEAREANEQAQREGRPTGYACRYNDGTLVP